MATATSQAPTEAEIRETIAERVREAVGNLWEMLANTNALDPITDSDQALTRRGWAEGFHPQEGHPGTLWADLTESEAEDLRATMDEAFNLDSIAEMITEAAVAAALDFAQRHPDIPRGHYQLAREPVPA
jgi:hypothetical protein